MTTQDLRPEVEERLRVLAPSLHQPAAVPMDKLIAAYLAGARDDEARELADKVFAAHKDFFDLVGDR
jgi:hypothetical protein